MRLILGDCLEKLKELPDNSVDSVVTDPPYGLSFMGKKWDYDIPSVEIWKECLRVLKPGGHLLSFAGTRTQHRMAVRIEDAGFDIRDMIAWVYGSGFPKSLNVGKQEGCKEWEGWGTALKPALEPITVARKPIDGTVAENCLKWGVGGINVDGCRVGTEVISVHNAPKGTFAGGEINRGSDTESYRNHLGRFPANLIHDGSDDVLGLFPETKSGNGPKDAIRGGHTFGGDKGQNDSLVGHWFGDSGSAARFFYCAKAGKKERNEGCDGLEEKQVFGDLGGTYQGLSNSCVPSRNHHPTVKPLALMCYLVRLVTPKGGVVLDPFMGSGTTGIACKREGMDFIGIEREAEYMKIAEARIGN